jgi:hypothetical protein
MINTEIYIRCKKEKIIFKMISTVGNIYLDKYSYLEEFLVPQTVHSPQGLNRLRNPKFETVRNCSSNLFQFQFSRQVKEMETFKIISNKNHI